MIVVNSFSEYHFGRARVSLSSTLAHVTTASSDCIVPLISDDSTLIVSPVDQKQLSSDRAISIDARLCARRRNQKYPTKASGATRWRAPLPRCSFFRQKLCID